ncbi:MAG: twin-arginine translocase subunit TatC [Bacteroidales bacterium]|nr:twin-arginine translocase subunit TatC [Bacteroidales bacterium]MBN2818893.1 twin-arginine translocase subunit TatC [Bacteroidales bacterium]
MSFLEHLEELRWHLVRSAFAVFIFATAAFIYKKVVFDIILMGPSRSDFLTTELLCQFGHFFNDFLASYGRSFGSPEALCLNTEPIKLQSIQMAGQFLAHIKISVIAGIIGAFPYVVYELWLFIKPALYQKEKNHTRGAVFLVSFLFILGVLFGYFIISPLSINFLYNYQASQQIVNNIQLMSFVSIVASISLASGILFELPAIIYFLSKVGIVTPEFLKKYRRHSLVVMLVLSAIITPPDIFSQILVCLPLIVLYEISIKISKRINKKAQIA